MSSVQGGRAFPGRSRAGEGEQERKREETGGRETEKRDKGVDGGLHKVTI